MAAWDRPSVDLVVLVRTIPVETPLVLTLSHSALHIIGIYFFTNGFLLSRLVLDNKSTCENLPLDRPIGPPPAGTYQDGCWFPRVYEKAVVVIIDALRYDFTVPYRATAEYPDRRHFHDSIPVLYDTAVNQPEHAFLLPFIADPPTTTLQRLQALTTGTLPTFIEAGSNFAGTAIEEDNIVGQLTDAGRSVVHLGDDTWTALFPGYFNQNLSHAYDSLQVRDLHTVDNGVIEHLIPLLEPSQASTWDVIFAHGLGVDHAGHRYGPDHPAMTAKLQQMNKFIQEVMLKIDERTLFVVMGDHGMDPKGDHGGESDDEVEAAIWFYSKAPRFGRSDRCLALPPSNAKERPVRQIDLVPTLSLLLGLPIPYNNLGRPIEEAFVGTQGNRWDDLAIVNSLSSAQIRRYEVGYSSARNFSTTVIQQRLQSTLDEGLKLGASKSWKKSYEMTRAYQLDTLDVFRELWAKFDIPDMLLGIGILTSGLICLLVYTCTLTGDKVGATPSLLKSTMIGALPGAVVGGIFSSTTGLFELTPGVLSGMAFGSTGGFFISIFKTRNVLRLPMPGSTWGWVAFVFTISQAAGFAANSYTIHEDAILLFFLTTFGAISNMSSLRQVSASDRLLGAYHSILFFLLTRASSFSKLCREEQMPGCRSTFYASSTTTISAPWQLLVPYVVAIVLPEIIKAFYKGTASYAGSAGFWIGFCFRIGLLLIAVYWTIDAADNAGWLAGTISSALLTTVSVTLARCILAIGLAAGLATFTFAAPCVDISVSTSHSGTSAQKPQVAVLGYANAHGTRYFLLLPVFMLVTALLLPPMGQFALAICSWQIMSLLEVLDTNGLTIASGGGTATGPIVLAMLGSYHFFKTGHQAVAASIQWNAAYVPLRTLQYPWSPLLVLINTLGAQMLCAAAVPLTVLWKRPVHKKGLWSDVGQAILLHVLFYATIQLATTLWAAHLRRHLMLYRVFMPRFLVSTLVLVTMDLVMAGIALTGVHVSTSSVGEVFGF